MLIIFIHFSDTFCLLILEQQLRYHINIIVERNYELKSKSFYAREQIFGIEALYLLTNMHPMIAMYWSQLIINHTIITSFVLFQTSSL